MGAEAHPLINSAGSGMTFENNLIEWTDWSAVTTRPVAFFDPTIENSIWGKYGSGAMTLEIDRSIILDAPNWLIRNHIHHSGPSVGLAITSDNVHSRLNRVSHQYALQVSCLLPAPYSHAFNLLPSPNVSPLILISPALQEDGGLMQMVSATGFPTCAPCHLAACHLAADGRASEPHPTQVLGAQSAGDHVA